MSLTHEGTVPTSQTWGNGAASDRASAAVDAQYGAEKTFEYFKTIHGRNDIWDNGVGARSRVHYSDGLDDAFWDGKQMTYGDGKGSNARPVTSLDVAAHEMTHGITQNTARLALVRQPEIWYRTLSTYLISSSAYADAREGAIQSATDLYGATSPECAGVAAAFSAVAVPPGAQTCSGTPPPPWAANLLSNPGFESAENRQRDPAQADVGCAPVRATCDALA